MEYINALEENNLEVSSEFLEMASRLVYIKTVSLLPRDEKEEDPKAELVGQLLEYQACKKAAALLRENSDGFGCFVRPPTLPEGPITYNRSHELSELVSWYWEAQGRGRRHLPPAQQRFSPIVAKPLVSVTSRIIHILKNLRRKASLNLRGLYLASRDKSEMVATFLAVLELLKGGRLKLAESESTIVFIPPKK